MAILNGVERSLSGAAPGAKKRTRHGSSPSKMTSEDMAKHSFPTLKSSSMTEHEPDDSLDWPTTGPFTYHRWHVMIERWAPSLLSSQCSASFAHSQAFMFTCCLCLCIATVYWESIQTQEAERVRLLCILP